MKQEILSQIFPYNKRMEMRNHPVFKQIHQYLLREGFMDSNIFGNPAYLLWRYHENKNNTGNFNIIQLNDWMKRYFDSGEERHDPSNGKRNMNQIMIDNGRTEEELWNSAKILMDSIKEDAGFMITQQAALNILVIFIIDDAFHQYMRTVRFLFMSEKRWPQYAFKISESNIKKEFGLDLTVWGNGHLHKGLYVDDAEESISLHTDIQKKQYGEIYNVDVEEVRVFLNGDIYGQLPLFLQD